MTFDGAQRRFESSKGVVRALFPARVLLSQTRLGNLPDPAEYNPTAYRVW